MQTGFGTGLPAISLNQILPKDLTMDNPRYEGYGDDGTSYAFTAKTAQQDLATPNKINLNAISGTIFSVDKARTDVAAERGIFDRKKSVLELMERIEVNSESGLKAMLTRATLFAKTSILVSNQPVLVEFPSGSVRSRRLTLKQKERQVTFVDQVEMRLTPEAGKAAEPATAGAAARAGTPFLAPSGEPVDITAARLDVDDNTRISLFTGNVIAKQGSSTLSTPELEVTYEGDPASGAAKKPAAALASGKLRRIVAKTPVVMTRGDAELVTSDTADFDALNETAILNGNVVMTSGDDRRVTCDRADLDQRADTALLTGETVVVVQGKNELRGRRLHVDRKAGHSQLTSPPGGGKGPGRVTAHLVRGEEKPEASAKTKARQSRKEAAAGATDSGLASFATDPNAPVDVEADQLDVRDSTKVAIFRGDVRAIQGGFAIASAELHAFYRGDASLADTAQPSAPGTKQGSAELTRIEAKKNVVVTSKDGQKAEGDWADFDAQSETVTVGGDVVLTQGQNVVHGTRLVIDMRSGESTIDTAPSKTVSEPGGGGWLTEDPGASQASAAKGRASAIFFPQQIKDANAAKNSAKETPKFAPDGWQAETAPDGSGAGGN
jgi:lipopolysaccharide transport protein LptA/LPS export ABC transporter protein LptC